MVISLWFTACHWCLIQNWSSRCIIIKVTKQPLFLVLCLYGWLANGIIVGRIIVMRYGHHYTYSANYHSAARDHIVRNRPIAPIRHERQYFGYQCTRHIEPNSVPLFLTYSNSPISPPPPPPPSKETYKKKKNSTPVCEGNRYYASREQNEVQYSNLKWMID